MKRTPNLKQMRAMEKGNNYLHKVTVNNQSKRETLEWIQSSKDSIKDK